MKELKINTLIVKFEDFVEGLYDIKYSSLSKNTSWHIISHLYEFQKDEDGELEEVMFTDIKVFGGSCDFETSWNVDSGVYDSTREYYEFVYIGNKESHPEYFI